MSAAARRRGIIALALALVAPAAARAADIPLIRVFPPECASAPVSSDDFVDALRVELAGRQPHCCVVGPGGDGATDAVKVTLAIEPCDPATQHVDVTVDIAVPPRTVAQQVSLADLPPEARPRALALAVAELLRSAGESPEIEAPPPPPPPPAGPPLLLTGTIAGEMHGHFSRDTILWGPRLGLTLSTKHWQLTLDGGVAASRDDVTLGELSILEATGTLFAGPRFSPGPLITSVGPALTAGWARIKGQSEMADVAATSGSGVISTLGLRAVVEGPATLVVRPLAYVEAGWTVRWLDTNINGQTSAGVGGTYLLLAAGVRFGPAT
jgi:hypothetical protein